MDDDIEYINDNERLYIAKAQLGEQARVFLNSPVGSYLHGRAKEDYDLAKEAILDCNPDTEAGIRDIKLLLEKAKLAAKFISWCIEVITEGEQAEYQFNSQER